MSLDISLLFSCTVLLPLIMGLIRVNRVRASYQPFLLFLLLAFTAEVVGYVSAKLTRSNMLSANIYTLLEAGLILYQFYAWGFLKKRPRLLTALVGAYLLTWIIENLIAGNLSERFCSYFVVLYSLVTVLLCINEINSLITAWSGNLFTHSKFLICIGFIIIGVYSLITEGTMLIDPENSFVTNKIFTLYIFINAFVNIVYAVAVYFMPVRDDYYFSKRFKA